MFNCLDLPLPLLAVRWWAMSTTTKTIQPTPVRVTIQGTTTKQVVTPGSPTVTTRIPIFKSLSGTVPNVTSTPSTITDQWYYKVFTGTGTGIGTAPVSINLASFTDAFGDAGANLLGGVHTFFILNTSANDITMSIPLTNGWFNLFGLHADAVGHDPIASIVLGPLGTTQDYLLRVCNLTGGIPVTSSSKLITLTSADATNSDTCEVYVVGKKT